MLSCKVLLACVSVLLTSYATLAWAQPMPALDERPPGDVTKRRIIERPIEQIVNFAAAADAKLAAANEDDAQPRKETVPDAPKKVLPRDLEKKVIERPVEKVLEAAAATALENAPVKNADIQLHEQVVPAKADDNPKVEPGKVLWHEDFAAACRSAKESGKPVLLFHLMGNLDERFT